MSPWRAIPLLATFALAPTPAVAQTTLVSNTGQTSTGTTSFGSNDHLQAFTTGGHASGYFLTRVDLDLDVGQPATLPTYTVGIYAADSNGQPSGSSLGTLANPASLQSGLNQFTASGAGIELAASTTYVVFINVTAQGTQSILLDYTSSDSEDTGAASGWSIANEAYVRLWSGFSWTTTTNARMIAIYGKAIGGPTLVSNRKQTSAAGAVFSSSDTAQAFTTGDNSAGYTLTGVGLDLSFTGTPTPPTYTVGIYAADSSGQPTGSSLGTLANPASLQSGLNLFTASGDGIAVAASTTYVVFVDVTAVGSGAIVIGTTASDSEDAGAASGWSIANGGFLRSFSLSTWLAASTDSRKIIVYGRALTGPAVTITGGSTVTEGTEATFTLTASEAPSANLTVNLTVSEASGDYVAASDEGAKTVTIPSGHTTASYSVPTRGDTTDEPPGSVTVTLGAGIGYTVGTANSASVTVNDDDGPPPNTPVVSISGGSAVTEGGLANFTVTASPTAAASLTVNLTIAQTGSFVAAAGLGSKTVTVPTSGSTTYTVATVDDRTDEANGTVTATLNAGAGYSVHNTQGVASVTVNDNDDPLPPGDEPDTEEGPPGPPLTPLQLALWTDRAGYRAGETVRLYRTLALHDDKGSYRTFVWLERAGGGGRRYLAPLSADGTLHAEAVDVGGLPESTEVSPILAAVDKELAWEGPAPAPGHWQFVLEMRPVPPFDHLSDSDERPRVRRAWARFVVAERSQLLNRAGFDREVRSDLTLHGGTIYYLRHQLFVHDGATLTVEPGTLLLAWGQNAAIIVEPGGRIVAEGTRQAPVVLTCSASVGRREPGCWGGLRILGSAPVTRLEGEAPGVLPAGRAVYGGTDAEGSSGVLRFVRVEFAGAAGEDGDAGPAVGLYGAGSGTVLDHVQAHASLGDGFAFHGGTARCNRCVASGSGRAGLSWERGWRGGASHLYVQHGQAGGDGLSGGHDPEGHDREPRSLPTLSNVTLVHSTYSRQGRRAVALRLFDGNGVRGMDLLATGFGGGAVRAIGRSRLLFGEGESSLSSMLLRLNGSPQVPDFLADAVEFSLRNPELRDVRDFANPDPRPRPSLALVMYMLRVDAHRREGYIGAFGWKQNWLEEWTVFGPESMYDLRQRADEEN